MAWLWTRISSRVEASSAPIGVHIYSVWLASSCGSYLLNLLKYTDVFFYCLHLGGGSIWAEPQHRSTNSSERDRAVGRPLGPLHGGCLCPIHLGGNAGSGKGKAFGEDWAKVPYSFVLYLALKGV